MKKKWVLPSCVFETERITKKKSKNKDGVCRAVDLNLTRNVKKKWGERMGVEQSCVFE